MQVKHKPTLISWRKMRERCLNPNADQWRWYGGKGVTVCDQWATYEGFVTDMGERPPGKTIDRIDPEGHYEPSNCRWATRLEQIHNQQKTIKVNLDGEIVALTEACSRLGVSVAKVYLRMHRKGMSFDEARAPEHRREKKTDATLREYTDLRKLGRSNAVCAAHFGMSEAGIEKWATDAKRRGWL